MRSVSPLASVRISGSRLESASTTSDGAGPTRTSTCIAPSITSRGALPTVRTSRV